MCEGISFTLSAAARQQLREIAEGPSELVEARLAGVHCPSERRCLKEHKDLWGGAEMRNPEGCVALHLIVRLLV
jgi:hypothetical protein